MSKILEVSAVPTSYIKDYKFQAVAKLSDSRYKVTDTIYSVLTYDKYGKLHQSTNTRYLDYII